ncbi:methionine adenosyltransferase [Nocardia sp. NPDC004068]|uniref:methionine adenosyltransferase n=1 Tax=Nocardia sp. NPDC004068 TaxID=3364303 RepID=UPI0036B1A670
MPRFRTEIDDCTIELETAIPAPPDTVILERKGLGHPDTLADHLAEELSRVYSRFTLARFGAILHHNFDKLALLGGASEVRYGAGRMLEPVRVLVNGRATRSCDGQSIAVDELAEAAVRAFFHERLPELEGHLDIKLNITSNSSPGAVHTEAGAPERTDWFAPKTVTALREHQVRLANDTSLGTGWAPDSAVERFARELADHFSGVSPFTEAHPWCGSDVKVMCYATAHELDVVACVPQKSAYVASRVQYEANKDAVVAECIRLAAAAALAVPARFRINVRDIPERDELYLTYTGSSIESGDEGVVGRGNRVNGLITPLRPMNVEGANGKNPVYHVGKLYNVAAKRLAEQLFRETGGYAEVHMVSATGQRLDRPWRILVRTMAPIQLHEVNVLVRETLESFPALTDEIVSGKVTLA